MTDIIVKNKYTNEPLSVDYRYLVFIAGLIFLHLFSITRVGLAQVISLLEAFIVLIYLVKGQLASAVFLIGVFTLTSYDNNFFFAEPVGATQVYNVSSLPILGPNFYLFLSFIIFGISLYHIKKNKIRFNNLLVKFALFSIIVMGVMGLITYIRDGFSFFSLIRDIRNCTIPALWSISFFYLLNTSKQFLYKYEKLILHVLLAYVIVGFITSSLGFFLQRGNRLTYLYLPLASFFYTSLILFIYEVPRKSEKIFVGIMFSFTVYFQLFFDHCLAGKSWIVFLSVIVVAVFLLLRKYSKGIMKKINVIFVLITVLLIISPKIISYVNNTENKKLLEFVSLIEGAQSGDLEDVDDSAQFRFLEFITISEFYKSNPQFLLLGRGLGGFVPNAGLFIYSETAFTDDQYKNNQFSVMHESLNVIYLKCGLIGLVFFFIVLLNGFKRIKYDPLFYIGIIWLFFYWAYSVNLLFIGLPAFLIAYKKMELNNKKHY